ncbi:MAG: hypothetical protein JW864_08130 [Spirochaetes bacterium]|nr:hypothetical protein [Spirochaetota bacterium]
MQVGIDAGAKFLKIVYREGSGSIIPYAYCQHFGNPEKEFLRLISEINDRNIERTVFTGLHAEHLAGVCRDAETVDEISAMIETIGYLNIGCKYIINVGAGSIKLIELDNGRFASYSENTLCAAGTGSFLDEQMNRMSFTYPELAGLPFIDNPPDIATRCAVFAKSDLIHRQQEGYSREEMWAGLCRGVVATMFQSVFKGDIPPDTIMFSGGLFLNPIIRKWVEKITGNPVFNDNGHFFSAIGTLIAEGKEKKYVLSANNDSADSRKKLQILDPPSTSQPELKLVKEYLSDGNEVRIHKDINDSLHAAMGIDIGSTSTKLVIIDTSTKDVVIDIYRRTEGNPVEAVKLLFTELREIIKGREMIISGAGTTGSGRKLVGKLINADAIVNEITAHFKGATYFDSSIETIFEIGGQDSKYIRGQNGIVADCNMNFVCAAGTGSFIEEQVNRLGFDIKEIGDIVLGLRTPHTSDRCTVFMEQDINKLLRDGFSREEVLAGVIRSIAKNYLNRVVGTRPVTGDRIFFQGATARNKGLVAAFEAITGKQIMISPYCHVMGAFGAALISTGKTENKKSKFRGLNVLEQRIELEYSKCDKCSNMCRITTARLADGVSESWGFMCGKETIEENRYNKSTDYFARMSGLLKKHMKHAGRTVLVSKKNKKQIPGKIGIPLVLSMYNHIPLWKTFLEKLGFEVILSNRSDSQLKKKAISVSKAEFCFPMKLSLAHYREITENSDIDMIFFPTTLSEAKQKNNMPRMLCPYVISYPSVAKETLGVDCRIISPSIDFRQKREVIIKELHERFFEFGFTEYQIAKAYSTGLKQQSDFLKSRYSYGQKLLKELKEKNEKAVICLGRPYNLYDKILNLGLTERLRINDITVFPYEYLIDPDENDPDIPHMYWNYGEKILSVAGKIKKYENIYHVYFTNFSCGPDSFILSRFEEIMRGRPYLIIELDEHGSETGYLTRIEAFMDVINEDKKSTRIEKSKGKIFEKAWKKSERKIWIPPMFEIAPRLFAAAFRGYGIDAEALEIEDNEAFEYGKRNTRGSECLPACTTIGGFLRKMKEIDADPSRHALFMPTAEGPCRFGQYSTLHKSILNKNGMGAAEIFSPTSTNSYMGMPGALTRYLLDVITASDLLSKRVYSTRPYEVNKGETDTVIEELISGAETEIENRSDLVPVIERALRRLSGIPVHNDKKPLVGIVGEIYVRSNLFCNNNVVRAIEKCGGEAWLSPFSEWVVYTAWMERYFNRVNKPGLLKRLGVNIKTSYMINRMHNFEHSLKDYLPGRTEPPIERVLEAGSRYVPIEFEGEVILTLGRTMVFLEDGASMVVNCAPFCCMPGNITTSIFHNLQREYNRPIINLFYDGESDVNRIIGIYLNNIEKEKIVYSAL